MDNIIDMIANDQSANEITDTLKDLLYAKAAEKVDSVKPKVATAMFDQQDDEPQEPSVGEYLPDNPESDEGDE